MVHITKLIEFLKFFNDILGLKQLLLEMTIPLIRELYYSKIIEE